MDRIRALAAACCFPRLTVPFILPGHAAGCHSLPTKQKLHVQSGRTAGGGTGVCAVDRYRAGVVTAVQSMLMSGWPGRCCAVPWGRLVSEAKEQLTRHL